MSLTSARVLASRRSGATFGSRAATGRVAAMYSLADLPRIVHRAAGGQLHRTKAAVTRAYLGERGAA